MALDCRLMPIGTAYSNREGASLQGFNGLRDFICSAYTDEVLLDTSNWVMWILGMWRVNGQIGEFYIYLHSPVYPVASLNRSARPRSTPMLNKMEQPRASHCHSRGCVAAQASRLICEWELWGVAVGLLAVLSPNRSALPRRSSWYFRWYSSSSCFHPARRTVLCARTVGHV